MMPTPHQDTISIKQLSSQDTASWYGTWSQERTASTKIDEESIIDEKIKYQTLGFGGARVFRHEKVLTE